MTIRLIKGGKPQDLSHEVKIKFAKLMLYAEFHQKMKEKKEILSLYEEYEIDSQEHLILLECFKQYDKLFELGPVPFTFIEDFKKVTETVLGLEEELNSQKANS
jgi:hypothetical protein